MRHRPLVFCFFLLFIPLTVIAQEASATEVATSDSLSHSSQLALSSSDYRVTAGDIYTLEYAAGAPVVYKIVVDTSYRIRVSNLGVINAAGKRGCFGR